MKKHLELITNVKRKDFGSSVSDGKQAFEKEIEAININRRVSSRLLFQNLYSIGELISYAGAGIIAVYNMVKNSELITGDEEEEDGSVNEDLTETIDDFDTEVSSFSAAVESYTQPNIEGTDLDPSKSSIEFSASQVASAIADMSLDNKNFLDSLEKGTQLNINTTTTTVGKSPAESAAEATDVNIAAPAEGYMRAANVAMDSVGEDIKSFIKPAYKDLNDTLSVTIDGFNKIFSIKPADSNNTPRVEVSYGEEAIPVITQEDMESPLFNPYVDESFGEVYDYVSTVSKDKSKNKAVPQTVFTVR